MVDLTKSYASFAAPDTDALASFYRDVIGLRVVEQGGLLQLQMPGGGEVLVYPKPDHEPATFTVLNLEVSDLDRALDELTGRGVQFEHYSTPDVQTDERGVFRYEQLRQAWFKDPAGNIVSILHLD